MSSTDIDEKLVQGSNEWIKARVGSLGASRLHEAIAKTKSGWGASRANLMAELVAERLTGVPAEHFQSAAMMWGTEKEPDAKSAYSFYANTEIEEVGLIRHPTIAGTHASPDGFVGKEGLVEIKAPLTSTHIETLRTGKVPDKYLVQQQWQMACSGRAWSDYVSFDPRMPPHMQLFVLRVPRYPARIKELETEVKKFLAELDATIADLNAKYGAAVAA
jgi:putative phage-type endonuclease